MLTVSIMLALSLLVCSILKTASAAQSIDRHAVVSRYNPTRNVSSPSTPIQVGNGNFAFGADITGLQTFQPFAIMSSWGWKNDSLPPSVTMNDILNWHGTDLDTHGREVEYAFSTGNDPAGQWLISNPNRVNLGRIGLVFFDVAGKLLTNISENDLDQKSQMLDLWSGIITSRFTYNGEAVTIQTASSHDSDTIGVEIQSSLISQGILGVFFDFPWHDGLQKFEAPFVGSFDNASWHTTMITQNEGTAAQVSHTLGQSTFFTAVAWQGQAKFSRDDPATHRYTLRPTGSTFAFSATYSLNSGMHASSAPAVISSSRKWWENYWRTGGFIDLVSGTKGADANELQRRIILSQYLLAVNEAGDMPTQESGLVNNGWYGKFHLEMVFWHMAHWSLWSKQSFLNSVTSIYSHFLASSIERAQKQQGYSAGARWGKMSDPSGRSAPGEINNLLIWQQPHPLVFAELEYRSAATTTEQNAVLAKWNDIVENTADFMVAYAWWNTSTKVYDLGPPMYPVSENTDPLVTINPTFELAYWRLGLSLASQWFTRQGKPPRPSWAHVEAGLAPLPKDELGRYVTYEGLTSQTMWSDPNLTSDHPALLGIYGWIPPIPGIVDLATLRLTADQVGKTWNISESFGWDFSLLAMTAARALGNGTQAVGWLLHPAFQFDDVGMPVGGVRVPTPYFPSSGGLLYAVAMMAEGWDGAEGNAPGFPEEWSVRTEGLKRAL